MILTIASLRLSSTSRTHPVSPCSTCSSTTPRATRIRSEPRISEVSCDRFEAVSPLSDLSPLVVRSWPTQYADLSLSCDFVFLLTSPAPGKDLLLQAALDARQEAQIVAPYPCPLPSVMPSTLPLWRRFSTRSVFSFSFLPQNPCTVSRLPPLSLHAPRALCATPPLSDLSFCLSISPMFSRPLQTNSKDRVKTSASDSPRGSTTLIPSHPPPSPSGESRSKRYQHAQPPPRPSPMNSGTPPARSHTHGRPRWSLLRRRQARPAGVPASARPYAKGGDRRFER